MSLLVSKSGLCSLIQLGLSMGAAGSHQLAFTKSIMQRRAAPHRMQWSPSHPRLWDIQRRGGDWEEDVVTLSGRHPGPKAVGAADGSPTS